MDRALRAEDAAIIANTTITLAGLALLGGLLPLSMAGGVSTYAAVYLPGEDVRVALASLSQAGAGWRVIRVLASRPVPILILAHGKGEGAWPAALLLPMPSAPGCLTTTSSAGVLN